MQDDKIAQGYKDSPLGIIPDDWEVKRLREVFDTLKSFSFSRNQMTVEKQKLRYIHYGDIHLNAEKDSVDLRSESLPYVFDDLISTDKITDKSFPLLKNRDIILADASEDYNGIGKAWEILDTANNKIIAGLHTIVLRDRANHTSIGYGRYLFRNTQTSKSLKRIAQGTKVYSISYKHISKLHLLFPPLSEQERITEILTCWDKAIEKQSQLIDRLEIRKRGLMQQLLTGKKRIKGFDEVWKKVALRELFNRITRKNAEGNTNVVTISAQRGFVRQSDFFTKNVASQKLDDYFIVNKGDFCYNKSYSKGYPWGAIKRLKDFEKAVVTTLYICFEIKDTTLSSGDFFEQYFEANILDKGLTQVAYEGGRAHGLLNVTPTDFFSLKIWVPLCVEQVAIANILSTADSEIQAQKEKLTALKSQKKGLMQQLLTGKKRVVNLTVI